MSLKGNEACRFSYYGYGILRCSHTGLEGYQCIGKDDCSYFEYVELELD